MFGQYLFKKTVSFRLTFLLQNQAFSNLQNLIIAVNELSNLLHSSSRKKMRKLLETLGHGPPQVPVSAAEKAAFTGK
jgi:hypothetical protein